MDVPQTFHRPRWPQPPPPPRSSSSTATSFPILAISIVGILTTSILLLSYYVFVIKCCLNWRRSDVIGRFSRSRRRWSTAPSMAYSTVVENRGLDESAIRAIPTLKYRKTSEDASTAAATEKSSFHECAVCLNEFQGEERIRLLPNCFHIFHIDCIDTWLQTHASCPLCRSSITSSTPIPADTLMAALVPYQDPHQSEDIVIEVRENDGGGRNEEVAGAITDAFNPSSAMKSDQSFEQKKRSRKLHQINSMGDECIDVIRGKDEQFRVDQPIRRSFSMDSSGDAQLYMAVQKILQQNPHFQDADAINGESSSSSSTSGRFRRSFFSFGRNAAVRPVRFEP